jgi:hypothetical protein
MQTKKTKMKIMKIRKMQFSINNRKSIKINNLVKMLTTMDYKQTKTITFITSKTQTKTGTLIQTINT